MTAAIAPSVNVVVPGLPPYVQASLTELQAQLSLKVSRAALRRRYYDAHNTLRDLGIAIPPKLRSFETVVGWPAKAVNSMSRRTILEGINQLDGEGELNDQVQRIWNANRLDLEVPASNTSALVGSVVFVSVVAGGSSGAIIRARSCEWATGMWDGVNRGLRSALLVLSVDPTTHQAVEVEHHLPGEVWTYALSNGGWTVKALSQYATTSPLVMVEAIPYQPSLERPFGRSRITRGVMYLTDAAVRTMLRTEIGAEFYNAPRMWALGVDDGAFEDENGNQVPLWQIIMGRVNTISRDEDGNLPTLQEFTGNSMQPNIEQLRSVAQMFAAETSLPVGSLGIVQDNPQSAEAIRAANEELGMEIEHWRRTVLGPSWRRVMLWALTAARHPAGSIAPTEADLVAYGRLGVTWGSWSAPSEVSQAQASLARIQAIPALADTDVELRRLYSADEVQEVQAQLARARSRSNLGALLAAAERQPIPGEVLPAEV